MSRDIAKGGPTHANALREGGFVQEWTRRATLNARDILEKVDEWKIPNLPAFFVKEFLSLDTGTVVTFFFTRITDLFRALYTRRDAGVRRVLTFPSGRLLLLGEFDLKLFVSGLLGGLGVAVLVGRREDAEGDGDASLKVQVDDFC